jgi:UTP--glucose-1-phosphate uridylyltransferase
LAAEPTRRLRKAVVPLAGRATRLYPASASVKKGLFPLVDRDGIAKPTIQVIVEEALASGVEEVCLVTGPGDEEVYRRHFRKIPAEQRSAYVGREWTLAQSDWLGRIGDRLTFAVQPRPEGYGHAVYCAREFVGGEPCLVMLGDHVYISRRERRCAGQLLDVFERYGHSVSAVNRAGEEALPFFGTVRGRPLPGETEVYEAEEIVEKPSAEYARARLRAEGLPEGQYLCYFGLHAMTPGIFDCLEHAMRHGIREKGEIQFTGAQAMLCRRERYLAFVVAGERYDTGIPGGLVETQVALALHSPLRESVERAYHHRW